jgi:peptidoglycan/xylan/chitin deacetylase (PgdA/CDA1 family)
MVNRLASLRHRKGSVLILTYHHVLDESDPMRPDAPTVELFESQMTILADEFNVLPLADAVTGLEGGRLPPAAVVVTFDDGYADNHRNALPVLRKLGLPATFFIATAYLDGGCMFNDCLIEAARAAPAGEWDTRVAPVSRAQLGSLADRIAVAGRLIGALKYQPLQRRESRVDGLLDRLGMTRPTDLMMSSGQVRDLHSAGMSIGAHTSAHPILARLDAAESRAEISRGREELQSIVGGEVDLFAYPNGQPMRDYLWRDVEILKRLGFKGAVSTARGVAASGADCLQLPRWGFPAASDEDFFMKLARARAGSPGHLLGPHGSAGKLR